LTQPDPQTKKRRIAGVIIGSVRHSGRRRRELPEPPPEVEDLRIRIRATDALIDTGDRTLAKEDKTFKGLNILGTVCG
jgi:hypothetical protein